MVVTMGYTGLRWGETIGLELDFARPAEIQVEWQLREVNGRFYRLPPKDDSYRSTSWEPCLPVDLPDFLADLIAGQIETSPGQKCACAGQHGGSGQYVFLGPDGGHCRRSNYARRVFRPACDGRRESAPGPARLIIADATVWPGVPVAAWPPAPPVASPTRTLASVWTPASAARLPLSTRRLAAAESRRTPRSPAGSRSNRD